MVRSRIPVTLVGTSFRLVCALHQLRSGFGNKIRSITLQHSSSVLRLSGTATTSIVHNQQLWRSLHHRAGGGDNINNKNSMAKAQQQTIYDDAQADAWDWDDKDSAKQDTYNALTHPGYALQSDPHTHVGGWLAHRFGVAAAEEEEGCSGGGCWIRDTVASKLTRYDYANMAIGRPPRILVLYGSLRASSFSRKSAYEFARLLEALDCDVRVYNPRGLPVRDPDALSTTAKVRELRALTQWSDGHVWVSPEMHGTLTGTFKNQIDWIPLNTGSVRPTQGRTCLVGQVNGGSQSFNAVNALRLLARWMRMPCCTNQSSIAKAWKEFEDDSNGVGRMKESSFRDRVVDCAEEFAKFTALLAPHKDELTDRYSERKEKEEQGRLLTQAEKEVKKATT